MDPDTVIFMYVAYHYFARSLFYLKLKSTLLVYLMMLKMSMMQMMVVIGHWMMSYAQDMYITCLNGGSYVKVMMAYIRACVLQTILSQLRNTNGVSSLDPVISDRGCR